MYVSFTGTGSSIAWMTGFRTLVNNVATNTAFSVGNVLSNGITITGKAGTAPTAGKYVVGTNVVSGSTYNHFNITKKHAQSDSFSCSIVPSYYSNTGFTIQHGTNNESNYPSGSKYIRSGAHTGDTQAYDFPYYTSAQLTSGGVDGVLIMTDAVFMAYWWQQNPTSNDARLFFVFSDQEYSPTIDDPLRTINSLYYPGTSFVASSNNSQYPFSTQPYPSTTSVELYQPQVLNAAASSSFVNNRTDGAFAYTGYQPSSYQHLVPVTSMPMKQTISPTGVPIHPLVPINTSGNDVSPIPRRLLGWYRTTDELGATGDTLMNGATELRLITGATFTGLNQNGNSGSTLSQQATYAFEI